MCILYRLRGVSVVFVVLGPLVVVLAACGPVFMFWRIQAKSVTVPVIISLFVFRSCTLCRIFPTCSVVRDLEKRSQVWCHCQDKSLAGACDGCRRSCYDAGMLARSALWRGALP